MRIEPKGQPNQWMNTSSANWWLNRPRVQQRCRSWWVASAIMHCTFGPSNRSGPQWASVGHPSDRVTSIPKIPPICTFRYFQYISGNPCITVEIGTPGWVENWGALILCGSSLSAMKNPRRSWWGGTGEDGELDGGNKLDINKRLGFHPDELPDVDVLNESSGGFNHCSFVLLWNSLYSNSLFMYSFWYFFFSQVPIVSWFKTMILVINIRGTLGSQGCFPSKSLWNWAALDPNWPSKITDLIEKNTKSS